MRISNDQYRTIHTLQKALGLSREDYEEMLDKNFGVRSSKDLLTYNRADELIRIMRAQMGGSIEGAGRHKYENLGNRPGKATPAQMRMIEAMFADVSHHRDQESRDKALKDLLIHRYGVMGIYGLERDQVQKVVAGLKAMKKQKEKKSKEATREADG